MNKKQVAMEFANYIKHDKIDKILLFGSVARGDDDEESDIDIFILTSDKEGIEDEINEKSFNLSLETNQYISTTIISNEFYEKYKNFSFFNEIEKEGILIG